MNYKHYMLMVVFAVVLISAGILNFLKNSNCGLTGTGEQLKTPIPISMDINSGPNGSNILFIYTGRWHFLRIQLAHVYRELRSNGGILDQVWFVLMNIDDTTMKKLNFFVKVANKAQGHEVFSIHNQGYKTEDYTRPYYNFFYHLIRNPKVRFFKFDDDIVYIHPRAFNYVIQQKDTSKCFMHFFNIAGSNWRCSWLHQKNGVYDETNPKNLIFEYRPNAECGWHNSECGEMTIRTFLHHYKHNQLDRYFFKDVEIIADRKRFSINAFLLDVDLIDIETMLKVGPITKDDEQWWSVKYTAKAPHPNCIVGNALVVHFAYRVVADRVLKTGLLEEFVKIVTENNSTFNMEKEVWEALEYVRMM